MDIKLFKIKFRLEILIIIALIFIILMMHLMCSCCQIGIGSPRRENFVGANTNYGESSSYTLGQKTDTTNWGTPNLVVTKGGPSWGQPSLLVSSGQPYSNSVKAFLERDPQPVPLPEGELNMFATTPFKPECCPSTYSNSMGCACITDKQYNYLIERGGNNIPYSEY